MALQNSISKRTGSLTIDPGASGDSYLQYNINGTGEFRIGVDDTDDSFCVSLGNALGTNNTLTIDDSGEVNKPLQPAFAAGGYHATVTGDGTVYTIIWDDEFWDVTSDYATATGTFTSPIDGKYRLGLTTWMTACNNANFDSMYTQIITSNRTYKGCVCNPYILSTQYLSYGQSTIGITVLADMDAADTYYTTVMISNGTKTVGIGTPGGADTRGYIFGSLVL